MDGSNISRETAMRENLKYTEGYKEIVLDAERSETRRDTHEMREKWDAGNYTKQSS